MIERAKEEIRYAKSILGIHVLFKEVEQFFERKVASGLYYVHEYLS